MCEPATISLALFAVGAAATTAATAQAANQAKETATTNNKRYNSIAEAAAENYRANLGQLAIRGDQEYAAAVQEGQQLTQAADAARGTVRTRAAAAGVSGNSVNALLDEFSAIEAASLSDLNRNQQWGAMSRQDTVRSLQSNMQQQLTNAAPSRIYGPSTAGYLASMAGLALQSYGTYQKNAPATGDNKA